EGRLYGADPFVFPTGVASTAIPNPLATTGVGLMTGQVAQNLGYMQQGYAGISLAGTALSSVACDDFRVDALWPSDFVQNVRPIASPSVKSVMQTSNNKYKAEFQAVVRASNPRWTSPQQQWVTSGTPLSLEV